MSLNPSPRRFKPSTVSMSASIQAQNSWLSQTLPTIFNSPAWQQQKSLLILTWDESSTGSWVASSSTYNQVVGVALASQGAVKAGYTSPRAYDHYSISRTIESALGLGGITPNDQYAQPLNERVHTVDGTLKHLAHARFVVDDQDRASRDLGSGLFHRGVVLGARDAARRRREP